jgi:transcriptional adapter 2-alpha
MAMNPNSHPLGKKRQGESLSGVEIALNGNKKLNAKIQEINQTSRPQDAKIIEQMSLMENLLNTWVCQLCDKDITNSIRIVCANCSKEKLFIFCLQCLQKGKQNFGHTNECPYFVMDRLNYNLFSREFSAKDEIKLIQGLMKLGMDNFQDIAEHVKTKIPEECEKHYYSFYYKNNEDAVPLADKDSILLERFNERAQGCSIDLDKAKLAEHKEAEYLVRKARRTEQENSAFIDQDEKDKQSSKLSAADSKRHSAR